MENLYNLSEDYDPSKVSELSSQTPVGWSSICLGQTISYYIECNSLNSYDEYECRSKESDQSLSIE